MWRIVLAIAVALTTGLGPAVQAVAAEAQTGDAACYSSRLIGHRVKSGERYDPNKLTAAHATIPLGSHVKVTNLDNGKSVVVLVNDRMSAHACGIIMDISRRACKELDFGHGGKAKVKLEVVDSNAK